MSELDRAALDAILAERLGPAARCADARRGPIGNGQETWFLELTTASGPRRLVLRRTAVDGTMSHTDRRHEFETLRRVAAAGLPVPAVHWHEPEPSALERSYLVMDLAPGEPLGRQGPEVLAGVARQLGGHLARLHAAFPEPVPAAEATRSEIAAWRRRYLATRAAPVPLLGALLAWLERNLPALSGASVLNWGDPGPHNLLVGQGDITALLDWEMSHPGHPLEDLGGAVWACLGQLDPEAVIAGYEEVSAAPVDRELLAYFEVLACVARSVAMLTGVAAYVEGRISAPAVAGLGLELLGATLERGALAAGWEPAGPPALAAPAPAEPGLLPAPADVDRGVARLLARDVLPAIEDARVRRLLKNAVALLESGAARQEQAVALADWRTRARSRLLEEMARSGVEAADLEAAAVRAELEDGLARWRPRLRRHLLLELAAERAAFDALRRLYGATARAAPFTRRAPL